MSNVAVGDVVEVLLASSPLSAVLGVVKNPSCAGAALVSIGGGFAREVLPVSHVAVRRLCAGSSVGLAAAVGAQDEAAQILPENTLSSTSPTSSKRGGLSSSHSTRVPTAPINALGVFCALLESLSSWRSPVATLGVLFFGLLAFLTTSTCSAVVAVLGIGSSSPHLHSLMSTLTLLMSLAAPAGNRPPPATAFALLGTVALTGCCEWLCHREVQLWFVVAATVAAQCVLRGTQQHPWRFASIVTR
ncbi:hypothetical protein DQ04_01271080 [Trypanosoma grayi]|uniref:hypothetical protein n=1 Tax=Trypanosoma grayi TaxID=71804 RepID=UPI0004F46006|nr:hypothetical protein DQ04_01271080 [Trypanosoma grayi]KEG13008.1 hypothetical protein DQ04_01271080 [Trypanosoma grayi]